MLTHKVFLRNDCHVLDRRNVNYMANFLCRFISKTFNFSKFRFKNVNLLFVNNHVMGSSSWNQLLLWMIIIYENPLPKLNRISHGKTIFIRSLILTNIVSDWLFILFFIICIILFFLFFLLFCYFRNILGWFRFSRKRWFSMYWISWSISS